MAGISRPPVVTILGHVDHGKTTLLDFIRKTSIASREQGGITQAIGAYQAQIKEKLITFIDTPGHAAFEKMRSRGAQVADIAVLVISCDDGVMLQTVEAIKHIQEAKIPFIVALTKIDLPGVDIKVQTEKIKKQLSDRKVLVEEYGGDVPLVSLSAKTGKGVEDLLETITLLAEIHELKGEPDKQAIGVVIESRLDKARGAVATVLIRDGTLRKNDQVMAGGISGKVKGMFDFMGKSLDEAGPSTPVEVLGFSTPPPVGAKLGEEAGEKAPKEEVKSLIERLKEGEGNILNIVIKADSQGSLEAVGDILAKFNEDETRLKIISLDTGEIHDRDVELASATKAIVLGFNVSSSQTAQRLAEANHVLVRNYKVIYELADEVKEVVEGILAPTKTEEVLGRAQILAEFPFGKGEKVAGCKVLEGLISKGARIRILRGEEVVGETKMKSLRIAKEEVGKVEKGQECGMLFDSPLDFQIGDLVESFRTL